MNQREALLDEMRCTVIYTDKATMPIPLYERIKDALATKPVMSEEEAVRIMVDASRSDVRGNPTTALDMRAAYRALVAACALQNPESLAPEPFNQAQKIVRDGWTDDATMGDIK